MTTNKQKDELARNYDIRLVAVKQPTKWAPDLEHRVFLLRKKASATKASAHKALEPFRRDPEFNVREVLHDTASGAKVIELAIPCRTVLCSHLTSLSKPAF